jgi:hypothetical protein
MHLIPKCLRADPVGRRSAAVATFGSLIDGQVEAITFRDCTSRLGRRRPVLASSFRATKSWCNAMTDKTTVPPRPVGFETFADAKRRRAQKIRILSQGDKDQRRLAAKLERCRKGTRCESGACDVCLRLYRLRLFRQTGPVLAARPHWTRASVVPAGFLLPLGELTNVELKALGEMIDNQLERSSLRRRIVLAGIDISLNLQDNNIIGWQLHLYMLIEGENTLRLREDIKAAFPPERSAPRPYDFDEVNVPANCVPSGIVNVPPHT